MLEVVRVLIKELVADVNQAMDNGCTPLCIAAKEGHLSVVQCLVKECGADIHQAMHDGSTSLMAASVRKHTAQMPRLRIQCQARQRMSRELMAPRLSICDGAGLKKCAGCLKVFFCGPACSRAHWPAHKADCKGGAMSARQVSEFPQCPPLGSLRLLYEDGY
jgi:hypothetical protein